MGSHRPQRRLTLAQLDALRTVIATNGVGEAARELGISQPAVSKLLRQAERGLGLSLMVRDGNRVVPTLEAGAIRDGVDALFGAYEALQRLASSLRAEGAGHISVSAVLAQATQLIPPAIRQFKAEFPSTTVKLHSRDNRIVINEVASGQADFGLGARPGNGLLACIWVMVYADVPEAPSHAVSFARLWAVQINAHSQVTFSTPRRRSWRKPRAALICPNTGSTMCFRSR